MTSDEIRALQIAAENDIPVERRAEYIATLEIAWQLAKFNERNTPEDCGPNGSAQDALYR